MAYGMQLHMTGRYWMYLQQFVTTPIWIRQDVCYLRIAKDTFVHRTK